MILPSGVVYMVNRIGPSTDPCGTPYFSVTGSDVLDPIWTVWVLSWRYDLNHFRASPLIPKEQSKGAFTLALSEHPSPSPCPRHWPSCVYTTSEARIRGHPRPWPFWKPAVATTRKGIFEHAHCTTSDDLGRPRPRNSLHVATSSDSDVRDKSLGHGLGSV